MGGLGCWYRMVRLYRVLCCCDSRTILWHRAACGSLTTQKHFHCSEGKDVNNLLTEIPSNIWNVGILARRINLCGSKPGRQDEHSSDAPPRHRRAGPEEVDIYCRWHNPNLLCGIFLHISLPMHAKFALLDKGWRCDGRQVHKSQHHSYCRLRLPRCHDYLRLDDGDTSVVYCPENAAWSSHSENDCCCSCSGVHVSLKAAIMSPRSTDQPVVHQSPLWSGSHMLPTWPIRRIFFTIMSTLPFGRVLRQAWASLLRVWLHSNLFFEGAIRGAVVLGEWLPNWTL